MELQGKRHCSEQIKSFCGATYCVKKTTGILKLQWGVKN